nr:VOC family protein [Ardenticatena sp.]
MGIGIDHLVVGVPSLEAAVDAWQSAGFHVVEGGIHAGGLTHNALIVLEDGTYIELLAPTNAVRWSALRAAARVGLLDGAMTGFSPIQKRMVRYALGPYGLQDFAVDVEDAAAAAEAAEARGLAMTPPAEGSRARPDGREVRWITVTPRDPDLPFFIQDLTPREWRVPPEWAAHPNRAYSIRKIVVLARRPAETAAHYEMLLDVSPVRFDEHGILFTLGATRVEVREPLTDEERAALGQRSARPWALEMRTHDAHGTATVAFPPEMGVPLTLVPDTL